MKAIILAAGYATRLYPLTENKAKPLLPVGGKPIINHLVENINSVPEINEIFVVTNNKFYNDFCDWRDSVHSANPITIINDNTTSDADKLGAIGDIDLVIKKMKIEDDLLIVAGDNLFTFPLQKFVDFYRINGLSIAAYAFPCREELHHYGIVNVTANNKVISFQEKPKQTNSNLVAVCLYIFPKNKLHLVGEYFNSSSNNDAPGYYLEWLINREDISAFVFKSIWHDIGTHEAYERAQKEFQKQLD